MSNRGPPGSWPLCALELKAHMFSSTDTTTCLRRSNIANPFSQQKFCDEIADYNVMYFVKGRTRPIVEFVCFEIGFGLHFITFSSVSWINLPQL